MLVDGKRGVLELGAELEKGEGEVGWLVLAKEEGPLPKEFWLPNIMSEC